MFAVSIWFTDQLSRCVGSLPLLLFNNVLLYSKPYSNMPLNIFMFHMLKNKYVLFNVAALCIKISLCVQHCAAVLEKHWLLFVWHTLTSFSVLGEVESAKGKLSPDWITMASSISGQWQCCSAVFTPSSMPFNYKQRERNSNNSARLPSRPLNLQKQISDDHKFQLMTFKNGSSNSS